MKFLADMGVSQTTVRWLRENGHDAVHARDMGMRTAEDSEIAASARSEGRIILTSDLDFGAIMSASGQRFPSVIILRLENQVPSNVNRRLEQVFKDSSDHLIEGSIVIVEDFRHRIRSLPL